jgi:hypothetical protein
MGDSVLPGSRFYPAMTGRDDSPGNFAPQSVSGSFPAKPEYLPEKHRCSMGETALSLSVSD